jgi:hypothetical protein
VVKEAEKKERSKGKASRWKRRSRKIKHQRRWIMDNSASGKRHQRVLWSTSWKRRRKEQAGEALKTSSGPRVLD